MAVPLTLFGLGRKGATERFSFSAPNCDGKECRLGNLLVFEGGRESVPDGSL